MHIPDPAALDDDDWAEKWNDLQWIRQQEAKASGSGSPTTT